MLTLKFKLGLFENPYTDEEEYKQIINCTEHLDKALEIAQKAIVMLKNNGILPLQTSKYKKIALIGPSSNKVRLGGYSAVPVNRNLETIYDILKSSLPECEIYQCDGCGISDADFEFALSDQNHLKDIKAEDQIENIEEAIRIAKVTADGKTSTINCQENSGSLGIGKWDGSSPYTLLMVATSIPFAFNNRTTGVVTKIAAKEFGTFGKNFGNIINTTIASRPMASVGISIVEITFE